MTPVSVVEDVCALWLITLQRAVGRASHDVKDALNGVSVNLEVIRSRAARPDTAASAVAQFAEAAGQQLERLTSLVEAVLALSRPERTPTDVGVTLRRVAALCSASASPADAEVRVRDDGGMSAMTRLPSDVVRLALTAPLLDLVAGTDRTRRASEVVCSLSGDADAVIVVLSASGRRAAMPDTLGDLLRSAGVRWTEGERDLSLAFPRT